MYDLYSFEQDHDGLVIRETTRLAHGAPRARRVPDREAVPAEPQRHGDDEEALGRVAAPFFFSRFTMVPSYSTEYSITYRFTYQEKASTAILSLAEEICIVVRISLDRCVICAPLRSLARRRGPPCRRCSSSHRPTRWTTQRDCSAEPITIFRSGGGPLRSIAAIIYILCDGKARARQKSVRWWCSRSHLGAL